MGVSMDEGGRTAVVPFLRDRGITYPVAMANGSMVNDFGGVQVLPTSFLIDANGRIRNEVRGIFTSVALSQAVSRLLAERDGGG